jgi:acyl-CoA thioesterase FadM
MEVRRVRFTLGQEVLRDSDGARLAAAKVTVACLTPEGKIASLPAELVAVMSRLVTGERA